jgi:chromosome partitioning protein
VVDISGTGALVIVIGMLKGGTGKTTTAIFTALHFAEAGRIVEVLDGDQTSQSSFDWARLAAAAGEPLPFDVTRFPFADDVADEITARRGVRDVVIVDAGGGSAHFLEEACTAADALVMPLSPTGADARRLAATMQSAERAAARNRNPTGLYVCCTLVKADRRTSQPRRWREQLNEDNAPLTDTVISDWVLYSDAYGHRPEHAGEYGQLIGELSAELELTGVPV